MICPLETFNFFYLRILCYSLFCFCRNALIGIIGKGGLRSLYAGWGAVLCRNVPHSIIKVWSLYMLDGSCTIQRDCNCKKPHTHTHKQIPGSIECNELERDLLYHIFYNKHPISSKTARSMHICFYLKFISPYFSTCDYLGYLCNVCSSTLMKA